MLKFAAFQTIEAEVARTGYGLMKDAKTCTACGASKPLDDFYFQGGRPVARCKVCTRERVRTHYAATRPRQVEAKRTYRQENRDAINQRRRGRDRTEESARYRERHREQIRERQRADRSGHALRQARRRARMRANGTFNVSVREVARMVARYRGLCAACGERPWAHLDHIIPIARGGRHSIGNLWPLCGPCNQAKYVRLIIEWRFGRTGKRTVAC